MLKNIKNPIEQLRFANTHATILGQEEFNNKLSEFVGNPNKLSTSQKINFILNGHKELTSEISTAKTDLDKLKQDILAGIEIKQLLADRDITLLNLLSIIKDKNPKLLKELFEARVILAEHKATGSSDQVDLSQIPSCADLNNNELTNISINGVKTALKNIWEQENNTKKPPLGNNGIPIPPPLSFNVGTPPPPPPPGDNDLGVMII